LADQQPAPIKLDFIQWIMRLLPLLPLLQIASAAATLRMLGRWERNPALRPNSKRMWGRYVLLPLIPNLSLAGILIYLKSNGLIRFMQLFMPDLAWIIQISGSFAGIWSILRSGLILRAKRRA
jgi:hypothetical protein